jgi:VWFA-related protein
VTRFFFALSAVLLAVVTGGVAGQQPSTPQPPVFRTSTRLIQVSVVVHDDRKKPIEGLRAEDFQLLEDGKPRPVAFFSVQGKAPTDAASAAQGVFTNRVQSPGGGVVAIIYDRLNTQVLDRQRVREAIVKYLGRVNPEDRIGLYVLDRKGMGILHDFTRDARSLVKVLGRAQGGSGAADILAETPLDHSVIGDALEQELAQFARSGEANYRSFVQRELAFTSIEGLEAVAKHLRGVPGRKNIIWISSGFPFEFRAFQPPGNNHQEIMSRETARAARALNDTDAAVYIVDARGLVGAFATSPAANHQAFTTLDSALKPIEGLRQFAQLTGGDAFFNTNDLGGAISRAVEDSRLTYVLGYYTDEKTWDGKFRRIQVKVRRDGADVRHRAGYFAIPASALPEASRSDAILDALQGPLESTALPLAVSVEQGEDKKVTLMIQFEPGTPLLEKRGELWHGALDLVIAQTVPPGRHTSEADLTIPLALNDATRAQLLKDGVRLTRTITLRDDAHDVRIVARDPSTGATGSVIIRASALRRP